MLAKYINPAPPNYLVETKQNIDLQTKANFLENDSRTDALIVRD